MWGNCVNCVSVFVMCVCVCARPRKSIALFAMFLLRLSNPPLLERSLKG